ncbi:RsmF rRNA methyltransferase first C-terminal domain-containing protein [Paenibacillus piri]|uniref:rRNA cytosine-C5-methyltransferase n=1 Tax=Paenibacillus piri TaxID=2547395 RepID=A0A4R5KK96_9BACL|nr:RsmB/NOP family class I SAM-dependent RNA methyltransferase [Paenibacillus piri]TDF95989.1 rRNA cytosine-C5-methyltransferase [Paenibacillus piri]
MGRLLPEAFLAKMKRMLGDDYPAFYASYDDPRWYGLRVNTLKCSNSEFLDLTDFRLEPIPWARTGYYYREEDRPGKHPHYHAGLYYIQEPSAMAPVELLDVRPGERVLDLCAAPGGKTTQIAAKLAGQGLLVMNDIHPDRVKALVKNIELCGVRNAVVLNEQPDKLQRPFGAFFDKILIDAPCSGEGMFRKEEDMAKAWQPDWVTKYAAMQRELLRQAAVMLRPGGRMVYSTCTFSPEENEAMIAEFIEAHPQFSVRQIEAVNGLSSGRSEWVDLAADLAANEAAERVRSGNDEREREHRLEGSRLRRPGNGRAGMPASGMEKASAAIKAQAIVPPPSESGSVEISDGAKRAVEGTARLWPHLLRGEGHFVAVLEHAATPANDESGDAGKHSELRSETGQAKTEVIQTGQETRRQRGSETALRPSVKQRSQPAVDMQPLYRFMEELAPTVQVGRLVLYGEHAYAAPDGLPDLHGIRVIRPGWYLGSIRKQRFEPSQALAMGLHADDAVRTVRLAARDDDALRYLKGETLDMAGERVVRSDESVPAKGYCLVCVDGYPVGWGKWLDGMLKNEYPAGWRWI